MKKACINCAYASEFYPSFMDVCDRDGHVIYDADEDSCEGFEPLEDEKMRCYTCRWWASLVGICWHGGSGRCGKHTDAESVCECWEFGGTVPAEKEDE